MHPQFQSILKFVLFSSLFLFNSKGFAQKVTIDNVVGSLSFGTFAKNLGGSITLTPNSLGNSSVSKTGDVFPITSGNPHSVVRIDISSNANANVTKLVNITSVAKTLSGSNGGTFGLTLNFSENDFTLPSNTTKSVYMGGTLMVGGPEDPAGIYSGSVDVKVDVTFAFQ